MFTYCNEEWEVLFSQRSASLIAGFRLWPTPAGCSLARKAHLLLRILGSRAALTSYFTNRPSRIESILRARASWPHQSPIVPFLPSFYCPAFPGVFFVGCSHASERASATASIFIPSSRAMFHQGAVCARRGKQSVCIYHCALTDCCYYCYVRTNERTRLESYD